MLVSFLLVSLLTLAELSKELQHFFGLAATLTRICRRISHGPTSPILYIRIYVYERGRHEDKLESLRQVSGMRGGAFARNSPLHCASLLSAITIRTLACLWSMKRGVRETLPFKQFLICDLLRL